MAAHLALLASPKTPRTDVGHIVYLPGIPTPMRVTQVAGEFLIASFTDGSGWVRMNASHFAKSPSAVGSR
jgi:hypothetical protein